MRKCPLNSLKVNTCHQSFKVSFFFLFSQDSVFVPLFPDNRSHLFMDTFWEINPMKQVPAMVHGDFKLFERLAKNCFLFILSWEKKERLFIISMSRLSNGCNYCALYTLNVFCSHAILRYLASAFPGVADHW